MKLGMPLPAFEDPERGLHWAKSHGLTAVYVDERWCPDEPSAARHGQRIREAGLIPAEIGAWCNPLDPDPGRAKVAEQRCMRLLALADAVEARCCVNIVGSLGKKWDGPCALDLSPDAFERVVSSVRAIVDAVQPKCTYYTLETMPWMLPDSAEVYAELLTAIDRPRVAVHFDPVNLINTPRRYFDNARLMRDFIAILGPHIRSVHVKDIIMRDQLTLHLDECRPGLGALDHSALLQGLSVLDPELPMMLEHCATTEDYLLGVKHLQGIAVDFDMQLH